MLNRKIQPPTKDIKKIKILEAKKSKLSNNIPVYTINSGEQDIVKIDFIFLAGIINHENPLIPDITNSMLDEGTKNRISAKIAQELDFYGSYLSLNIGKHRSIVTLYTLNKYLHETVEIIHDIIKNTSFPEKEFNTILKNDYQNYVIDQNKTDVLASDKFRETIFGSKTAYGRTVNKADFDSVTNTDLINFHAQNYNFSEMQIIMSGKITNSHFNVLETFFGCETTENKRYTIEANFNFIDNDFQRIFIEKKDAVQSSIMIGSRIINKTHPDYFKLNIVNTILGGYFGSRLMTNIREDKGYTYGIYSSVVSLQNSGYFVISAETGKDVCEKAITEIFKEIDALCNTKVSNKELMRVKNYLSGSFISNFNGAFELAEAFKSLLFGNLTYDYYYKYFDTIKSITPNEIQYIAQKYLNSQKMHTIVAGN